MGKQDALTPKLRSFSVNTVVDEDVRDKGGRLLKGGKWRLFYFEIEVCLESPKDVDEAEAAEDATDFVETVRRTQGRVGESFASVTNIKELPVGIELKNWEDKRIKDALKARNTGKAEPVMEAAYPYEDLTDPPTDGKIKDGRKKVKKAVKKATKKI